jgi:hypothetical protein
LRGRGRSTPSKKGFPKHVCPSCIQYLNSSTELQLQARQLSNPSNKNTTNNTRKNKQRYLYKTNCAHLVERVRRPMIPSSPPRSSETAVDVDGAELDASHRPDEPPSSSSMHSQHHHVHRDTDNNNIIYDSPSSPSSPGLRNRRSASNNSDHPSIEMSAEVPVLDDFDESSFMHDNTHETPPQSQQTQPPPPSEPHQQTTNDAHVLHNFWRTFDDVVILSLFAIFGIVFRMLSATWFSLELAFVFSEDSALSTNLPLNCLSCFLLGLLCSGR